MQYDKPLTIHETCMAVKKTFPNGGKLPWIVYPNAWRGIHFQLHPELSKTQNIKILMKTVRANPLGAQDITRFFTMKKKTALMVYDHQLALHKRLKKEITVVKKVTKQALRTKTTAFVIGTWKGKTKSNKCHYVAVHVRGFGIRRFAGSDVPVKAGEVVQCHVTARDVLGMSVRDVSFV